MTVEKYYINKDHVRRQKVKSDRVVLKTPT